jgi:hypothetical protein
MALKRWIELVCDICQAKRQVELTGQEEETKQQMVGWYNIVSDTEQGPETYLVCSGKCMKDVAELAMKATIESERRRGQANVAR